MTEIVPVNRGGTGVGTLPLNFVLVGNGTSPVLTTLEAPTSDFMGDVDIQTITTKNWIGTAITNSMPASFSAPISANKGGLGTSVFPDNIVPLGNGTGVVNVTKAAPASQFVGINDIQTLTNKNFPTVTLNPVASPIPVNCGGTGSSTFTVNAPLISNGTGAITTPFSGVSGSFVGDADTQTLTNKTFNNCSISTLSAPLTVANGGTGAALSSTASVFFTTNGSSIWQNSVPNVLPKASGGTGLTAFSTGKFLTIDSGGNFVTTLDAVSDPMNTGATQTVTNPSFGSGMSVNSLTAPVTSTYGGTGVAALVASKVPVSDGLGAFSLTDNVPSGDFVFDTPAQTISNKTLNNCTFGTPTAPLGVASGGLGVTNLTAGNFLVGNGTGAVTFTPNPSGALVGINDTQTLLAKDLTAVSNTIYANGLSTGGTTFPLTTVTAPSTTNQYMTATGTNTGKWASTYNTLVWQANANGTASITTTPTTILGMASSGSLTLGANTLVAGSKIEFVASGVLTLQAGNRTEFTLSVGAVSFTCFWTVTNAVTDTPFRLTGFISVPVIGASGFMCSTMLFNWNKQTSTGNNKDLYVNTSGLVSFDTTSSHNIDILVSNAGGNVSSYTLYTCKFTLLKPA